MSMTISAGSQSVHLPNIRAQSSEATPPAATAGSGPKSSAGSATGSATAAPTSQQLAALKQLTAKYSYDLSHGVDASTLSNLGKQVMAAAQAVGQHVRLPSGSPGAAPVSNTPVASSSQTTGKVNLQA